MEMKTCEGCIGLDFAPEPYEVSCREGGIVPDSQRCPQYFNPLESDKVLSGVLLDISRS